MASQGSHKVFMKPSLEAFVNPSDGSTSDLESLRIAKGYLNHRGLVLWVYNVFFCKYAVQRGNGYDLPDNADKYRSGGRADVAS